MSRSAPSPCNSRSTPASIHSPRRSGQPAIRRRGWTLLGLLAAQIGLGGITVLLKLPDLISTAHLVNALLIFGGLLVLAASEGMPRGIAPGINAVIGALSLQARQTHPVFPDVLLTRNRHERASRKSCGDYGCGQWIWS